MLLGCALLEVSAGAQRPTPGLREINPVAHANANKTTAIMGADAVVVVRNEKIHRSRPTTFGARAEKRGGRCGQWSHAFAWPD
ncbi:MAG: hypothetical protein ABI882_07160 [Acidobacteriota bacterium]